MRIGANARVQWGAVMALLAGLTTVGAIGVAGAQDPVAGVGLAAAGPRFLAVASSKPSDAAPRWKDASNAAVFRKTISVDLKDVPLGEALSRWPARCSALARWRRCLALAQSGFCAALV